jgi:hypothetical protein
MTGTIFWPKMLTQMVEKHNMRVAWELKEEVHTNHKIDLVEGTVSAEMHLIKPEHPMHLATWRASHKVVDYDHAGQG